MGSIRGRAEEAAVKSLIILPKKRAGAVPGMLSPVVYPQVIEGCSKGAPKAASFPLSSFEQRLQRHDGVNKCKIF